MAATRRKSRKEQIVERAAQMIANDGYEAMSLRKLADAMQMSKGTILHHFGSKDQLLKRVHSDYMCRRLAEARLILELANGPAEQLAALIYQLMVAHHRDRDATVAFGREFVRFVSSDLMADVRRMRTQYTEIVRGVVEEGMRTGEFRDEDPALVTLMIFGMCNWSWTWYKPDGSASPEQIAALYVRSVLTGIAAENASASSERRVVRDALRVVYDALSRAAETVPDEGNASTTLSS